MSDTRQVPDKGLKVLVIHAPARPPNVELVAKLLRDAGIKVARLMFATPADVASGKIDPSEFDKVIAILDDELGEDPDLDAGVTAVAQGGHGLIGIWSPAAGSEEVHRATQLYGTSQCPWDPEAIAKAFETARPQALQSSSGGSTPSHGVRPNRC